jgi:aryl-alcohol dehydrogenase-like predicted oxidoreductase
LELRRIGSLSVSLVGIGCNNFGWRIDAAATKAVVDAAISAGINFFDTADFYGAGQSEEYLGKALGARRKDVLIATKFGLPMSESKQGGKAVYVKEAVEASLGRLGTDYIDLYQFHRPDPETPVADTLGALNDLVREGKVREIGCSNFTVELLRESESVTSSRAARWVSVQNHYSMMHREPEQGVLDQCARQGLGFLPYFPLENGLLTGKYHKGAGMPEGSRGKDGFGLKVFTDENLAKVEELQAFAKQHERSLLELAFGWLASKPVISSIIAGAKNAEQVGANATAVARKLTPEELAGIAKLLT